MPAENTVTVEMTVTVNGKSRTYRATTTTPGDPEKMIIGPVEGLKWQAIEEKSSRWWEKDSTGGRPILNATIR